jgi:hypothetical protein
MDAHLRAPRMAQGANSIEQQLPGKTTATVTYMGMHTSHTLRTVNINAPLPMSGLRPYGNAGNLYLYESDGVMNQGGSSPST